MRKLLKKICLLAALALLMLAKHNTVLSADIGKEGKATVKDFKNDFLVYDQSLQNYLPYIPKSGLSFPTLNYFVDLKNYSGYQLYNCLPSGSSIFIEQKIVVFNEEEACVSFSIDSLKHIYRKDSLFITVFNPTLNGENVKVQIVAEQDQADFVSENDSNILQNYLREISTFNDFYVLGIIVLLILFTVLYRVNMKYFQEFYNVPKALSLKIREESYITVRNITGSYLFFILVHSFIVGFILLTIIHYYDEFRPIFYFLNTETFLGAAKSWLQLSGMLFLLFWLKFIFVKATSQLFNINGFSTIHFFEFVRMSTIFFLLILITLSIMLLSYGFEEHIWLKPLINSVVVFFIFRMIILFLKLYKYAPFRNLHLFLYICSTELLPILVGVKIFIK